MAVGPEVSDRQHVSFGVRTVTSEVDAQGGRLFRINGKPVVESVDWCREETLDPSELSALGRGSLYDALAAHGSVVHHGVASITPTRAGRETAKRLKVPVRSLLLTLFQVDSTSADEVALVSVEHHLADAFEFTVYRRGPGEIGDPHP